MCGITGFWQLNQLKLDLPLEQIAKAMAARIRHRGPNAAGAWSDETAGIALGFQRLAIIDLSSAGCQPMISHSGQSVIVYNGEIYNALELKKELMSEGKIFKGKSDTEIVLAACETWGVYEAVRRFNGMFAFAFWNARERKLFLVRDRLGIKPLYWGFHKGALLFASELKSFFSYPIWNPKINRDALVSYFRFNYIPAEQTIYQGIHKVIPGTMIEIDNKAELKVSCYWNLQQVIGKNNTVNSEEKNITELDALLRDAVKRRMVADVPLGAFLSGGIDSSLVVALMQAENNKPVKTFTIGFHEAEFNEAIYAKKIANYLGTEHHELYLKANDAIDVIPNLVNWYDEPFADSSQIPTYLVSKLASQNVTVSLSGDGGDELFAGYDRYHLPATFVHCGNLPLLIRKMLAKGIKSLTPYQWSVLAKCIPQNKRPRNIGVKAHKYADVLAAAEPSFYKRLVSFWENPVNLVLAGRESQMWSEGLSSLSRIENMQWIDTTTYLPDDILTKVDRASMAVSLESRVPILDHRVVEFAWSLPQQMKFRSGQSKWLLRKLLSQYLPEKLINRPKMGFAVPIGEWLRGPLREWADDLLAEKKLASEGILNAKPIVKRWHQHLSGQYDWQHSLWGVLMFEAWYQHWH